MNGSQHERLQWARAEAGFEKPADAIRAFGWTASTYHAHENGQNSIRPEAAARYAAAYNIRVAWLLTGDGDPKKSIGKRVLDLSSRPLQPERVPLGEEFTPDPDFDASLSGGPAFAKDVAYKPSLPRGRPEIDARAGAGQGALGENQVVAIDAGGTVTGHRVVGEWVIPEAVYRGELHASPGGVFVMAVDGESMRPTLEPGDRIFVDGQRSAFTSDGIYLIDDGDGEPRVKRLEKVLFSKPAEVLVRSDNPGHGEQTVRLSELRVLGRVCGRLTRM